MSPTAHPQTQTIASGPDWTLHLGDALAVLAGVDAGSVDAAVLDPPAGVSFMQATFDTFKGRGHFIASLTPIFAECLRVCRPGAVALAWALPRTSHWTATALEDAGWSLEEKLYHVHSQGFPKHRSKLKPAVEEWICCRKPGPKWLGVEECRIPAPGEQPSGSGDCRNRNVYGQDEWTRTQMANGGNVTPAAGRYPANLLLQHHPACRLDGTKRVRGTNPIGPNPGKPGYGGGLGHSKPHDYAGPDGTEEVESWICHPECPVLALDIQAGHLHAPGTNRNGKSSLFGQGRGEEVQREGFTDSGGPSRFFATFPGEDTSRMLYCPKASRADRGHNNNHPCVKSVSLMSWLVKLACPAGGLVLDCFMGSGSTGLGCLNTGRRFLGVERDGHYFDIARNRLMNARGPLFAAAEGGAP